MSLMQKLMQKLNKKYDQTLVEFESIEDNLKNNTVRRDHFIQGLAFIVGATRSGGSGNSYSYYGQGKMLTFNLDELGEFQSRENFLKNVHEQMDNQL